VKAYLEHTHAMSTPGPGDGSRKPDSQHQKNEGERERRMEGEVVRLLEETKLWRAATSVLWVAWAIVQADLDKELAQPIFHNGNESETAAARGQIEPLEGLTDLRPKPHANLNNQSSHMAVPAPRAGEALPNDNAAKKTIDAKLAEEEEGAFDYLGCAQDRVLVFWGDIVSLGIVSASELPGKLLKRIKICDDRLRTRDDLSHAASLM
jgi:choline kinase